MFKIMDKKWNYIRMEEGAINELISLRDRRGVTIWEDSKVAIWEDSEDNRLPQHLAKPGDVAY